MKTEQNPIEFLTNTVRIDRWARVRLADLEYAPGSNRPDDCGGLYIAPVVGGKNDPGTLALFATTNGDPILLAFVNDGEIFWADETSESKSELSDESLAFLKIASWDHPKSGEGYSYFFMDAVTSEVERRESLK